MDFITRVESLVLKAAPTFSINLSLVILKDSAQPSIFSIGGSETISDLSLSWCLLA